jgi:spoIIIJ-associated protein
VGFEMLYSDQVASSEDEAVVAAVRQLRLSRDDCAVCSVTETPNGVKVRVEARKSRGLEAQALLKSILNSMGIEAELFYIESFEKITINIKGPHLGLIIGKGGSTLESLETIISAIHNRHYEFYKPVFVNPGGYRENKRKALKTLVKRAIGEACDGKRVCLPSMSQRDRRQVHQILKEFPGFRSRSFGEGKDRKVFIYSDSDGKEESGLTPDDIILLASREEFAQENRVQTYH